ncbi:MAG: ERCC4 domain-containing protein [Candidatus Caldarchaeum sp.]
MAEVIVDAHEPEYIRELADRVETLPVDILIIGEHRKYAIERKTVSDYWNSVTDGRLWRQMRELERLRDEEGYIPLVLVVGKWEALIKRFGITIPQFIGMQLALSTFGVTPIWVSNKESSLVAINYLRAKAGKPRSHPRVTIPKPMSRTIDEEVMDVLCAVRGIGEKTAEKLLGTGKSLRELFSADLDFLVGILGESKAGHFYEVVNYRKNFIGEAENSGEEHKDT